MNPNRLSIVHAWLFDTIKTNNFKLLPIPGDASFRRYYRVLMENKTYILMDAPPEKETIHSFIHIANIFRTHQVCAPEVIAKHDNEGLVLLTDFGDVLLSAKVNPENVGVLYPKALSIIKNIQTIQPKQHTIFPNFDIKMIDRERQLFIEWFLQGYLKIDTNAKITKMIDHLFARLSDNFLNQPQVCVHRDFHASNLMILPDDSLGVIDFQDAVIGPITYDIVSLLKDSRIPWSPEIIHSLLENFYQEMATSIESVSFEQFVEWFDLTGLQLHLKILGIFARLHLRDGKSNYLRYIPFILDYVAHSTQKYSFLDDFHEFLVYAVQPSIKAASQ